MWDRQRPGLYVRHTPVAVGEIERSIRGWWWWFVSDMTGRKKGAGRCLHLERAKEEADEALADPQLRLVE